MFWPILKNLAFFGSGDINFWPLVHIRDTTMDCWHLVSSDLFWIVNFLRILACILSEQLIPFFTDLESIWKTWCDFRRNCWNILILVSLKCILYLKLYYILQLHAVNLLTLLFEIQDFKKYFCRCLLIPQ